MGSLPKQHGGCSHFFQLSITLALSHFYPDTNGKYFPGLISTDQRHFLNREEPHSPGGERSPEETICLRGHGMQLTCSGTPHEQMRHIRTPYLRVRTQSHKSGHHPISPGAAGQAINPFSSPINLPNKKLGVYHVPAKQCWEHLDAAPRCADPLCCTSSLFPSCCCDERGLQRGRVLGSDICLLSL